MRSPPRRSTTSQRSWRATCVTTLSNDTAAGHVRYGSSGHREGSCPMVDAMNSEAIGSTPTTDPGPEAGARPLVGGPATRAIGERPAFGPMERLGHDELVAKQQETLTSPRRSYSLSARLLFSVV